MWGTASAMADARCGDGCRHTIVFFHAHPDDEAIYTGGTMAALAAAGHRTVLITATNGEAGLTAQDLTPGLAERRVAELAASAAALGVARVVLLGYPDSGSAGEVAPGAFSRCDVDTVAARVAAVLLEEQADILTVYDPAGGYGHPDHRHVHRVGTRAAELAGTPVVLEATVDRAPLQRVLRLVGWLPGLPRGFDGRTADGWYVGPAEITHRVDVRAHLPAKREALRAHHSQQVADGASRMLGVFLRLPGPLFALVLGREWFVHRAGLPVTRRSATILDTLHG